MDVCRGTHSKGHVNGVSEFPVALTDYVPRGRWGKVWCEGCVPDVARWAVCRKGRPCEEGGHNGRAMTANDLAGAPPAGIGRGWNVSV